MDAQPSSQTEASMIVLVTGQLMVRAFATCRRSDQSHSRAQVDDSPMPLNYSQTFQLKPEGGSYYV